MRAALVTVPVLLLLAFSSCRLPQDDVSQPSVSVQVIDETGLVIATCDGTAPCPLRSGRDSLVVHASLAGIQVDPATSVTAPTIAMTLNGATVSAPPTLIADSPAVGSDATLRSYTSTKWLAPVTAQGPLTLQVNVASGYAASVAQLSVIAVIPPTVSIDVVDENGMIQATCDGSKPCALRGGRDSLIAHARLDSIFIDPGAMLTAPTLTMSLNGTLVTNPPTMVADAPSPMAPRSFTSSKWLTPFTNAGPLSLQVNALQGYGAAVGGLSVSAADKPTIALTGCDGQCALVNDVGSASFSITGWYPAGTAIHVQSIVDSVTSIVSPSPAFTAIGAGPNRADVPPISVPASGTSWTVSATVDGAATADPLTIQLSPPILDLALPTSPCVLTTNQKVNFKLTAPKKINTTSATIRYLFDMSASATMPEQSLMLDADSAAIGTFTAPATAGTLTVEAIVGKSGYQQKTCVVQ